MLIHNEIARFVLVVINVQRLNRPKCFVVLLSACACCNTLNSGRLCRAATVSRRLAFEQVVFSVAFHLFVFFADLAQKTEKPVSLIHFNNCSPGPCAILWHSHRSHFELQNKTFRFVFALLHKAPAPPFESNTNFKQSKKKKMIHVDWSRVCLVDRFDAVHDNARLGHLISLEILWSSFFFFFFFLYAKLYIGKLRPQPGGQAKLCNVHLFACTLDIQVHINTLTENHLLIPNRASITNPFSRMCMLSPPPSSRCIFNTYLFPYFFFHCCLFNVLSCVWRDCLRLIYCTLPLLILSFAFFFFPTALERFWSVLFV